MILFFHEIHDFFPVNRAGLVVYLYIVCACACWYPCDKALVQDGHLE